jgi:hypothetical protein
MYLHTFAMYDAFSGGIKVENEIGGIEEGKAINSCTG